MNTAFISARTKRGVPKANTASAGQQTRRAHGKLS